MRSKGQDKDSPLAPLVDCLMAEAPMDASASSQIDSISWVPSHWTIVGPSWKGFSEIRYLFILYVRFASRSAHLLPTNRLPTCGSTNVHINHLAETRTAKPSVDYHGLFYTLETIPQTRVALKVISSLLFDLQEVGAQLYHFFAHTNFSQHRDSFSKELKQKFHLQTPPNNLLRQMSFR